MIIFIQVNETPRMALEYTITKEVILTVYSQAVKKGCGP